MFEEPEVKPTPGRIVHFVPESGSPESANYKCREGLPTEVVPAIVVSVHGNGSLANLQVFIDSPQGTSWVGSAKYDSSGQAPRSWHWPPRV